MIFTRHYREKHIQECLSLCVLLALFVLKKNNTYQMCVNSKAITKITIKYKFPTTPIEDMLGKLNGLSVF